MAGRDRLDGWKAIASHFGRDRSTVMRWARDRQLPVRRVPGGKHGSVFALSSELDAWSLAHSEEDGGTPPGSVDPTRNFAFRPRRKWLAGLAASLLVVAGLVGAAWVHSRTVSSAEQQLGLPLNAQTAQIYLAARDAFAGRTDADLKRAIRLYNVVIRRDPTYAPAYSGLAEAWLIICEYGGVSPDVGQPAARVAADRAIALDPNLAAAYRVKGYLDYWVDNDASASVAAFSRALRLDPNDMMNHFWYANVLADIGEDAAAEREYARARMMAPGSQAIAVEHACAQWQAGRDELATRMLGELARRYPNDATIHNCLVWVDLGKGDARGVAREYGEIARLRQEPETIVLAQRMSAVVRDNPKEAINLLVDDAMQKLALGEWTSHETVSFYASAAGDRARLAGLLSEAVQRREQWYSTAITRRIAQRWRDDVQIRDLVARVTPPPISLPGG